MGAKNQTEQALAMIGEKYIPSSYQIFAFLVNSAGSNINMHDIDVTSGTPERFSYTCQSGCNAKLTRCCIDLLDNDILPVNFGGLASLTTGIAIRHYAADNIAVIRDFMDGQTIKKNSDWAFLAGTDAVPTVWPPGTGDHNLPIRWTFEKSGSPLFLCDGESFAFDLQDSTTGITDFRAMVQGVLYPDQ